MLVRTIALALVLCGSLISASAQQSLADIVSEAQAEWMLGEWEGTTQDGSKLTHSFAWDLDKKVIVMRGKVSDMAYMGITVLDPTTYEPVYRGYDNQGRVSKGTWGEESGSVALRLESAGTDGETRKMAVLFTRRGDQLELSIHALDQWGYVQYPAGMSISLKKNAAG